MALKLVVADQTTSDSATSAEKAARRIGRKGRIALNTPARLVPSRPAGAILPYTLREVTRVRETTLHRHATHPAPISRLDRAIGHLRSPIEMIEAGKPRLGVAQQLQAVEKSSASAERTPIHDHVDLRLDAHASGTDRAELKAIARHL